MIKRATEYVSGAGLGPTLVRAVTGSGAIRLAGMGFGFLVGVQLARGLGPAGYGVYGLVMSFISILAIPVEFGLPSLLTREVAANAVTSNWGKVRGIMGWAGKSVLLGYSAMLAVLAIGFWLVQGHLAQELLLPGLIGLLFIPMVALGNLCSATLRGLQQLVKGDLPDVLARPMCFSLLLALATIALERGLSPSMAIALQVAAVGLSLFLAAYLLGRELPASFKRVVPVTTAKEWRSAAFPMAMSEGMRIVQGQLPILVLGWMVPAADVGLFRVASSMLLLLGVPITLFNVIAAPVAARLHAQGDRRRLQKLVAWAALMMSATVLALSSPFFVAAKWVLDLVFGVEYVGASAPLVILALGCCLNALFGVGVVVLNMTGYHSQVTRIFAASLACLVIFVPLLTPLYGINGAAFAIMVSMCVSGLLAWLRARSCLGLDTSVAGWLKVMRSA